MIEAKTNVYGLKQSSMTHDEYRHQLTLLRDVVVQHGGRVGCDPGRKSIELKTESDAPLRPMAPERPRGVEKHYIRSSIRITCPKTRKV